MRFLPLFAAIFAITPLAIDMYLPALILIANQFNSPIQTLQNSISIFLAGYALGMFLLGPMADRFGRRPLMLFGLSGFVVSSGLLAFIQTADGFLALRFLQAFFWWCRDLSDSRRYSNAVWKRYCKRPVLYVNDHDGRANACTCHWWLFAAT